MSSGTVVGARRVVALGLALGLTLGLTLCVAATAVAAPKSDEEWLTAIWTRFQQGQLGDASALATEALVQHPKSVILRLGAARVEHARGEQFDRSGFADRAKASFTTARRLVIAAERDNPDAVPVWAHQLVADIELRNDDVTGARKRIDKAIAKEPTNPESYRLRARCHRRAGDLDAVEADAIKAVELAPTSIGYVLELARLESDRGRGRDAIARLWRVYRNSLALDDATAWLVLAQIHDTALDLLAFDESKAAMTEALRVDPDNTAAQYELGIVLYREEKHVEADTWLAKATADATRIPAASNAEASFRRGLIARHRDDLIAARRHLERATALAPTHRAAWQTLAAVLQQLGETDAAGAAMARFRQLASAERAAEKGQ